LSSFAFFMSVLLVVSVDVMDSFIVAVMRRILDGIVEENECSEVLWCYQCLLCNTETTTY
jgi:hypothetical protein